MYKIIILTITATLIISITSCKDEYDPLAAAEKTPPTTIDTTATSPTDNTLKTNTWIQDVMEECYLWEANIPSGLDPETEDDSKAFFDKFIYEEDHWSWISDDYYETENLYSGVTTTSGIEYSLSLISDNYTVIGIVEYVMPGSPGDLEGVKRGDIFTEIAGATMTLDNYYDLITRGGSYTLTLASIENSQLINQGTVNITEVKDFQENPILIDTVYEIEGKKIGYLVYNSFLADYNDAKAIIFDQFKSAGVTDLIIDLRYNGGGSVAAEQYLANLIAPSSAIGEIFSQDHYNTLYSAYFKQEYGDDALNTRIGTNASNINLSGKLVGLVSSSTASASEGLLNGLAPLVDLTLIGDTTHGKYTGMWVLPDDADNPEWAIIPIVVKSSNKDGISVKGGMSPDIILYDEPLDGYQLGDIRETMLASAIGEVTGTTVSKSTKATFKTTPIAHFNGSQKIKALPRIVGWGNEMLIKH